MAQRDEGHGHGSKVEMPVLRVEELFPWLCSRCFLGETFDNVFWDVFFWRGNFSKSSSLGGARLCAHVG